MDTFYKSSFTQFWLTLSANEPLGIVDTNYLEDYFGVDGQITLRHLDSQQTLPMLMQAVPDTTPGVENDVFEGFVNTSQLVEGIYELQFRTRDPWGNYTICGAVQTPYGGERIISYQFLTVDASGVIIDIGGFVVMTGGYRITVERFDPHVISEPLVPYVVAGPLDVHVVAPEVSYGKGSGGLVRI